MSFFDAGGRAGGAYTSSLNKAKAGKECTSIFRARIRIKELGMSYKSVLPGILFLVALLRAGVPVSGQGQAPADKPVEAKSDKQVKSFEEAIAPYLKKAKETLPDAKKRYLKGLPKGEHFFVTTRLYAPDGKFEQVFVKVTSRKKEEIKGLLASDVALIPNLTSGVKQ